MGAALGLAVAFFIAAILTVTAVSVPGVRYSLLAFSAPVWVVIAVVWATWVIRDRPGRAAMLVPVLVVVLAGALILDLPLRARFAASKPAFEAMIVRQYDMPSRQGLFTVDFQRFTGPGETEFMVRDGDRDGVAWGFAYSLDGQPGEPINGPLPIREVRYRHLDGNWYVWAFYDPDGTR